MRPVTILDSLVVALANEDQAIQVSDRRLVVEPDGTLPTEESDKAITLTTLDARLAVGYTGLGEAGPYRTHDWLLKTLTEVAKPDCRAGWMLPRPARGSG